MDYINTMVKEVLKAIDKKLEKLYYAKAFPSVVYGVNDNGTYTIIKDMQKYNVKCCNPNLDIKLGTKVWVMMPIGRLHDMHIYGVR